MQPGFMDLLSTALIISKNEIMACIAAIVVGYFAFKLTKNYIHSSLIIFIFLALTMDSITIVTVLTKSELFSTIVLMSFVINLILVLGISNIMFYYMEKKANETKTVSLPKTDVTNNNVIPKVTTKNKFNKRSLYRLSK
jgi:hypothetical protein